MPKTPETRLCSDCGEVIISAARLWCKRCGYKRKRLWSETWFARMKQERKRE